MFFLSNVHRLISFTPHCWLRIFLLLSCVGISSRLVAQVPLIRTIGTTSSSTHVTGPIYQNTVLSGAQNSRYAQLYTAAELALPLNARIVKLEWIKTDTTRIEANNTFRIYLANTAATTLSTSTWGTLLAGTTMVYSSNTFSIPPTTNTYIGSNFNQVPNDSFIYTGGSLLVLEDWVKGGYATGPVKFFFNSVPGRSIGAQSVGALSNATNLSTSVMGSASLRPTIRISYVVPPPCAGVPLTGGVVSQINNVCAGQSFTLKLANSIGGTGVTYQWQRSDNALFTSNVLNLGTLDSLVTSQSSPTYYRCIARCAAGPLFDTSAAFYMPMSAPYLCTCTSGATSTGDEEIFQVTFASLSNSSNCSTVAPGSGSMGQMYSNYQGIPPPVVERGAFVPFSIQVGTCTGGSYANVSAIFIDYNRNGSYADMGELVYSTPVSIVGPHTESGTIQIPLTAATGVTGMRIITSEQNTPITNPCLIYSWGETEDYVIQIDSETVCSGLPVPGNTIASDSTVCKGLGTTLSLANPVNGAGITYQWYNTAGIIAGATSFSFATPALNAPEMFYCAVTCNNSGMTANSTPLTLHLKPFMQCYCMSSAGSDADSDIFSVMLGGVTNALNCSTIAPGNLSVLNQYSDFRPLGQLTSVELNGTLPFSIEADDCDQSPYYAFAAAIWIDYNQNGSFLDPGEKVFVENYAVEGPRIVSGSIGIPCDALTGITGMRIMIAEGYAGSLLMPCLMYGFGETEDYLIEIIPQQEQIEFDFGSIGYPSDTIANSGQLQHVSISAISQGNNANTAQSSILIQSLVPSNYIGASGQFNAGITARNQSLQVTDTSAYFQFTITPDSGYSVMIDSIHLGTFSAVDGPTTIELRTSADNYTSSAAMMQVNPNSTWAVVSTALNAVSASAPLHVRLYGYVPGGNGTVTTGDSIVNWRVDDIALRMIVSCAANCSISTSVNHDSILCNGDSTTITIVSSGGVANYSYQLNNNPPQLSNQFQHITAGTYTIAVSDAIGCTSSTVYTINQPMPEISVSTETKCDNFVWPVTNQNYTNSGVYTAIGMTANGCLKYDTLMLTIFASTGQSTSITACDTYTWQGTTYTISGNYTNTSLNASSCVHTDTLQVTIHQSSGSSISATACDSYTWQGTTYTISGTYTKTSLNAFNCVHTDTLQLSIHQSSGSINIDATACDSYTWQGTTYTISGIYTKTSLNASNCVHTDTLQLTIHHSSGSSTSITACDSYTWQGTTYTISGTYTQTSLNASSCVHTDTLQLMINYSSGSSTLITACNSYTWQGTTYTISGIYTKTSLNAFNCVHTDTLQLTIHQSSGSSTSITACDSYTWQGTTYTISGTYTKTSLNAFNCVHTDTLQLTIHQSSGSSTSITACDSYSWQGTTYTISGTYTKTSFNAFNCVHTDTLQLSIQSKQRIINIDDGLR
jgi:hypothetical protein